MCRHRLDLHTNEAHEYIATPLLRFFIATRGAAVSTEHQSTVWAVTATFIQVRNQRPARVVWSLFVSPPSNAVTFSNTLQSFCREECCLFVEERASQGGCATNYKSWVSLVFPGCQNWEVTTIHPQRLAYWCSAHPALCGNTAVIRQSQTGMKIRLAMVVVGAVLVVACSQVCVKRKRYRRATTTDGHLNLKSEKKVECARLDLT